MELSEMCSSCLSLNRKLVAVTNIRENGIYSSYFDNSTRTDTRICWECRALFVKMYKFRSRVTRAQVVLMSWTKQKPTTISSLSSLSTQTKISYDECYEHDIKAKIITVPDTSNTVNVPLNDAWSNEANIEPSITANMTNNLTNITHTELNIAQNEHTSIADDSLIETKIDVNSSDIKDDVVSRENSELISRKASEYINKLKFVTFNLSEQEMINNRELERESPRYKACTYKCEMCIKGYYDRDKYEKHLEVKHSECAGKHVCPICSVRFSRAQYHVRHVRHVRAHYRGYRCRQCARALGRRAAALAHHAAAHEQGTKYACVVCQRVFDNKRSLRYHRDKAHRELPRCGVCKKTFSSSASLKTHMATHSVRAAAHRCASCARAYCSAAALRAHTRLQHARGAGEGAPGPGGAGGEAAYCVVCDAQLRDARAYARHLATHRAHVPKHARKFPCEQCAECFASKSGLTRHETRKHRTTQTHQCDHCEQKFSTSDRLKAHVLETHDGVPRAKDKMCSYCGRGFTKRSTLTNHMRVHTGERPYACDACDARFTQKSARDAHSRAHARTHAPRATMTPLHS